MKNSDIFRLPDAARGAILAVRGRKKQRRKPRRDSVPHRGDGVPAPEGYRVNEGPRSIEEIEAELEDLKGRMPAHSVRPHMMMRLEELEDELEEARKRAAGDGD